MSGGADQSTLLIESQYFPNLSYYKALIEHDILEIEKYEHYQKVSFRNRCYVAGPNGMVLLSVPLTKGKNQRTVMKDVRISYEERWQSLHFKTLVSAYRRSPWFEYYEDDLAGLFEQRHEFLIDWNMACFEWVNKKLGVATPVTFSDTYRATEELPAGTVDARNTIMPGNMAELGSSLPSYTQVFEERTGFMPNLGILDLLFCEGKHSLQLLQG
ncbi:WbqC-like protein [Chitinophaga skermanii]|uniref:WbqC-like protein n=1 Tax=Chitinophaga skermanii TaxID=331697 RepID=A0A327QEE4_9BACT|nr:WbqC family protein [Chitinophaga skermanii]RAJ02238.1 WbqC-like protein [Chitinophaga skermanii]